MKKILLVIAVVVIVLGALFFAFNSYIYNTKQGNETDGGEDTMAASPQNATFIIDGQEVVLRDGISEVPAAPGSEMVVTTRYFGNEVEYDFNEDGTMDTAFIITQDTGGSGVFFYVVAALNEANGYVGSNAVFLGDRIAPQATRINTDNGRVGVIEVTYVDRNEGEDFSVVPSVGKSLLVKLDPATNQLGSVETDFEGEANPEVMSLTQKPWQWIRTNYSDGRVFVPKQKDAFVITFAGDDTMSATTDCNGVSGSYTALAGSVVFGSLASTMMYCDGSEEGVFNELLGQVSTYTFTSQGELELGLKAGEGIMILR